MLINILSWLVIGLLAGWLASMIMGRGGYGVVGDIIVGLIGALVGGFLGSLLFGRGLNEGDGWDFGNFIIALIGAIIVIAIVRALSGNRSRV